MAQTKSATEKKDLPPEFSTLETKFEAYVGNDPYIFVSYSHRDTEKVYPVLDALYDMKFRIWYDESCETGNDFREELRVRIKNCQAVLLFVSESSMSSPFCGMEILTAKEYQKKIVPVCIDNAPVPPAFKIWLDNIHHGNLSNHKKLMDALRRDLPSETMDRLTTIDDRLEKCEDNGDEIEVTDGIRVIGKKAFQGKVKLKHVKLPTTVEEIEAEAFRACPNIAEMIIPKRTNHIGASAFRDCTSMKTLEIRNGLIKIGERAFENCASLSEVVLPDDLAEIYGSLFNGCKSIKSIKLPQALTVIGENAFADCVSLESIELPENMIKIDDLVFSGCSGLKSVEFPEGLKKIGKAAFKNCTSLTQVCLPASIAYISTDLFRGCSSMRTIRVNPKNKYYKSEPNKRDGNDHVLFNKNKSLIIAYPASSREVQYSIPDSVITISDWTFSECQKLNRISIPDSVKEIGEGAFCNCILLDELEIPDSVEMIDDCAFRGCEKLERILIPSSVKEVGWGMFDGCPDNLVVYCETGSTIYDYCIRNGIQVAELTEEGSDLFRA